MFFGGNISMAPTPQNPSGYQQLNIYILHIRH